MKINDKKEVTAVYDSGSVISLINSKLVELLKIDLVANKSIFKTISGLDFCTARATVKLKIGPIEKLVTAYVVKNDNFSFDFLLGLDAIKAFRLIQDENLKIFQKTAENKMIEIAQLAQLRRELAGLEINYNEHIDVSQFEANLEHIQDDNKRDQILNLISQYKTIFARDKYDVGCITASEAQIRLFKDEYITRRPYKTSIPDRQEIEEQIKNLLERGLISESSSPFAAPVTLALKKGEMRKSRLCIDFTGLNKLVVPESHPFPKLEDILERIANCKYFTTLDVNSAFWCIPIRVQDREKTAFVTEGGHFQWNVLPFGLKISSAVFQRVLSSIIRRNNLTGFAINFIDDVLIFSRTFSEHLQHIRLFLEAVVREGFKLKLLKCRFAASSVDYLGHHIEHNKVSPASGNLTAIQNLKRPADKSGVKSVLGSINFFRKYIDNPTEKFEPLHKLLRKKEKFVWTQECEDAFTEAKRFLCTKPVLAIFDYDKEIVIETDASGAGIAATLKQPDETGLLHPVFYFSRRLTPTEKKLGAIYLECKAIRDAIRHWQYHLIGRPFTVCTDHRPLVNLKTRARTDELLGDMIFYLSQFNFRLIYKPGKENVMADWLSRYPVCETFECEDAIRTVNLVELAEIAEDQRSNQRELAAAKKTVRHGDTIYKNLNERKRVFVSQRLGRQIIDRVHDHYGHIGSAQLAGMIRPYFYFRNLDKMIGEYCSSCSTCLENKTRRRRLIGLMSHLGPSDRPFKVMSIDSVGGFANNRSPKRYMHILADHFTRYAWIATSKGQSARDLIALIDPIAKKQKIGVILADQYSGINSRELKSYLRSREIELVFTSVDCASSNGLNERLNQSLVNRIRCRLNSRPDKCAWTTVAQQCVDEYNRTMHTATRFAPAYLLDGSTVEISPLTEFVPRDLEADRRTAFENSLKSHEANKRRVDRDRVEHEFRPGDKVYIENGSRLNRRKMDKTRIGPFAVVAKLSNTIYEVASNRRKRQSNLFHVSKLLPFSPSPEK